MSISNHARRFFVQQYILTFVYHISFMDCIAYRYGVSNIAHHRLIARSLIVPLYAIVYLECGKFVGLERMLLKTAYCQPPPPPPPPPHPRLRPTCTRAGGSACICNSLPRPSYLDLSAAGMFARLTRYRNSRTNRQNFILIKRQLFTHCEKRKDF